MFEAEPNQAGFNNRFSNVPEGERIFHGNYIAHKSIHCG